jgi:hypothetical protein
LDDEAELVHIEAGALQLIDIDASQTMIGIGRNQGIVCGHGEYLQDLIDRSRLRGRVKIPAQCSAGSAGQGSQAAP